MCVDSACDDVELILLRMCSLQALERRGGVSRRSEIHVNESITVVEQKFDSLMTDQLKEFLEQCAMKALYRTGVRISIIVLTLIRLCTDEKLGSILLTKDLDDLLHSNETKRSIVMSSAQFIRPRPTTATFFRFYFNHDHPFDRDTATVLEEIKALEQYVSPECIKRA